MKRCLMQPQEKENSAQLYEVSVRLIRRKEEAENEC